MKLNLKIFPFLVIIVALAILLKLGFWQLARQDEKLSLQAKYNANKSLIANESDLKFGAKDLNFKQIIIKGHWLTEKKFYLDLRKHRGKTGMQLIMPLSLASGKELLVNRGWFRHNAADKTEPQIPSSSELQHITGIVQLVSKNYFEIGVNTSNRKMFIDIEQLREQNKNLLPILILQTNDSGDGLVRDWPKPNFKPDMHLGYAIMWFSLAFILLIIGLYIAVKREENENQ